MTENINKAIEMAKIVYNAIDDKQGEDIKIIDIQNISTLADYFIIAHGKNKPHIQAVIDEIEKKMHENGYIPKSIEGYRDARWVLIDYINVIVHVFHKEDRLFYDLERIWADGKVINYDELVNNQG